VRKDLGTRYAGLAVCGLGITIGVAAALAIGAGTAGAQQPVPAQQTPPVTTTSTTVPSTPASPGTAGVKPAPASVAPAQQAKLVVPADYVIGPDDLITVMFWRDKDMSADVVVRPDGNITLPLLNDVAAGGLTPEQLRAAVQTEAAKYLSDPLVNVTIKQINSRKVFVTGMIARPGAYPLSGPTTVLQFLSMAGGLSELADDKKIVIMRTEDGKQRALKFNYRDVSRGKNLQQNILLKPGDTVIVP
jgi:polysaccharide export outer membrane protein